MRSILRTADLVITVIGVGGMDAHCFNSQGKYFVLQMPCSRSHFLNRELGGVILQRTKQNILYYVCVMHQIPGLNFVPKTVG